MPLDKPEILYVASHWPCGSSVYGAQLRVQNIGRLLARAGKVSLVIAHSEEIDHKTLEMTRDQFDVKYIARINARPLVGIKERLQYEVDSSFLNTHFSSVSKADREYVGKLIKQCDMVWVHTIRTANAFQIYRWPCSVLDIDDFESQLYARKAEINTSVVRKFLDYRMSLTWRRREFQFKNRFDVLTVCSEADRQCFGSYSNIHVVHNGFAIPPKLPHRASVLPARLGFIGLFDYIPNRTGMDWFIRKIWPQIKREIPLARLRLVGKGSDKEFPEMGSDIDGLGYVEDPINEMASWSAMIVPIQLGGGTRVKIAEAFSRKCPVVSTALGAYGYEVRSGEELLLANSAEEFGRACVQLVKDPSLGERLAENAWKRFLREWTWEAVGEAVEGAVGACLRQSDRKYLP